MSKSVEAAMSHVKLNNETGEPEEKIALNTVSKDAITNTESINAITSIEKMSETHGSNEALIPQPVVETVAPTTATAPVISVMDVTPTTTTTTTSTTEVVPTA